MPNERTITTLDTLVINYLTQSQYDAAKQAGTLDANQLYLTPDTNSGSSNVQIVEWFYDNILL